MGAETEQEINSTSHDNLSPPVTFVMELRSRDYVITQEVSCFRI